ncbi:MAG: hypothetical protein QOJ71_2992, partial [Actinomycetota bacterium]|nr:hypothetical protein [Actinomycetota bacterium]
MGDVLETQNPAALHEHGITGAGHGGHEPDRIGR